MSMYFDPVAVISGIVGGIGAALCLVALALFGIRRGCRKLAVRLNDLEERFMSLRGRKAAAARWEQEDWLKSVTQREARPQKVRYDNDPPELDPDHGVPR